MKIMIAAAVASVAVCAGDPLQNADSLDLDERTRYTAIRKAIDATGRTDVRVNIGRGLTPAEERTHFGMWCIQSSPLLIGCDLTSIPGESLRLISNPELIAVNQDTLGRQAYIARADKGVYLYVKDILRPFSTTRAAAVYNSADSAVRFTVGMADIDLGGKVKVRDLIGRCDLNDVSDSLTVELGAHDTAILRLDADKRLVRRIYEAETAYLPQVTHAMPKTRNAQAALKSNLQGAMPKIQLYGAMYTPLIAETIP